jgi:dihydrofolate reductase
VSGSLTEAGWNNTTVLPGDPDRLREVKEQTDGNLTMSGSATTVRWLLANGLLDELHLLVHPIAVGSGQRLFEGTPTYPLKLVSQEAFGSGVLYTVYAPA